MRDTTPDVRPRSGGSRTRVIVVVGAAAGSVLAAGAAVTYASARGFTG